MIAWTICCSCAILYFSLPRGQAERIPGNDLLDDYDDDLDGFETDVWTEKISTKSGTEIPPENNRTPSGMAIYTADNSTRPKTDVWPDADDISSGSGVDVPTDNNVTRSETDFPADNNVTRSVEDIMTDLRTQSSKTTASIVEPSTGVHTTRFTVTAPPAVCRNSSCPDLLKITSAVSEGENITLSCGSASNKSQIWWYRDFTVLQGGVGEAELYIVDSDRSHSGSYLCADERGCCIVQHHLSVYHVPPYIYHLAVMGAILAVGIPFCVFLSVRQSSRLGRYARMFNERHGEAKQLIL